MANNTGFGLLLDFLRVVARRKAIIAVATLLPALVAVVVVLATDSTYKSVAVVNPPSLKPAGGLETAFRETGLGAGALSSILGGGSSGLDECVNILESVRLGRLVIDRFDLETVYKVGGKKGKKRVYFADVFKVYRRNVGHEVTDESALRIWAKDKSPERAAEMVAFVIHALDSLYTDIQLAEARNRMEAMDKRLEAAEAEMRAVEDSLVAFQNRHNLLAPQAQVRLILENAAQTEIRLESVKEEMALERALRGSSSARYHDLETQVKLIQQALNRQLRDRVDTNSLILPTQALPGIATDYFRLDRAYTIRLGVYRYLVQQVEALRLSANQDIRVISVVDPPWVNDKRISPRRRMIVQAVFIISLLLSVFAVVLHEAWNRHRREYPESERIAAEIRSNLFRLKNR